MILHNTKYKDISNETSKIFIMETRCKPKRTALDSSSSSIFLLLPYFIFLSFLSSSSSSVKLERIYLSSLLHLFIHIAQCSSSASVKNELAKLKHWCTARRKENQLDIEEARLLCCWKLEFYFFEQAHQFILSKIRKWWFLFWCLCLPELAYAVRALDFL